MASHGSLCGGSPPQTLASGNLFARRSAPEYGLERQPSSRARRNGQQVLRSGTGIRQRGEQENGEPVSDDAHLQSIVRRMSASSEAR
jgi:hypothetical protein